MTAVHAHKCQACAKSGKQVFWIHSDDCKGVVQAHKCPECGTVEWKKALIEPAAIPQKPQAVQQDNNIDTILGYAILLIAVALLGYAAYLYYQKKMKPKKEVSE